MAFLFNSLHPPIHVRKHIYFTRFLFYCAIFGNAILFCLFVCFTPKPKLFWKSEENTICNKWNHTNIFFSVLKAYQCYTKKEKMSSPRMSLAVPNKYAEFLGLVEKYWNQRYTQGFANDRLFMYIHNSVLQPLVHLVGLCSREETRIKEENQ